MAKTTDNRPLQALDFVVPTEDELVAELKTIRREGIARISQIRTPSLETAVRCAGHADAVEPVSAYMIEGLIREAVVEVDGPDQDIVGVVLGLAPGRRGDKPSDLRRSAAEIVGTGVEHFRKSKEPDLLIRVVQQILSIIHAYRMRLARLKMDKRTPVGSRLAVEWLKRFEAYYRIWSPISGLGNDLTAARLTMLKEYTEEELYVEPDGIHDLPDGQNWDADNYVRWAWSHYCRMLHYERLFDIEFGGLWLLPDAQAETNLADAIHQLRLHVPQDEQSDSLVRSTMAEIPGQEIHQFLKHVPPDDYLMGIHEDWQDFARSCECTWDSEKKIGRSHFPIAPNYPGIDAGCPVHKLLSLCNDYLLIVDDAWDEIADWYDEAPFPQRA